MKIIIIKKKILRKGIMRDDGNYSREITHTNWSENNHQTYIKWWKIDEMKRKWKEWKEKKISTSLDNHDVHNEDRKLKNKTNKTRNKNVNAKRGQCYEVTNIKKKRKQNICKSIERFRAE